MPRVSPDKDGGRIQRRCHPPSDNTHGNYQEDKIAIDRRGNRYRNPERERERTRLRFCSHMRFVREVVFFAVINRRKSLMTPYNLIAARHDEVGMRCVPAPDSPNVSLANLPHVVRALVPRTAAGTNEGGQARVHPAKKCTFCYFRQRPSSAVTNVRPFNG